MKYRISIETESKDLADYLRELENQKIVKEIWGKVEQNETKTIKDRQDHHNVMLLDIYERLVKVENYMKVIYEEAKKKA